MKTLSWRNINQARVIQKAFRKFVGRHPECGVLRLTQPMYDTFAEENDCILQLGFDGYINQIEFKEDSAYTAFMLKYQ